MRGWQGYPAGMSWLAILLIFIAFFALCILRMACCSGYLTPLSGS